MNRMAAPRSILIALSATLVAAGCGGGRPVSSTSVTKVVGSAGGTVTLGDQVTLFIPTGAVGQDQTITVSMGGAAPVGFAHASPVYQFGPAGLKFATPVTVTLPIAAGSTRPTVYWSRDGGPGFDDLGGVATATQISAAVQHFSEGFVADAIVPDGAVDAAVDGAVDGGAPDVAVDRTPDAGAPDAAVDASSSDAKGAACLAIPNNAPVVQHMRLPNPDDVDTSDAGDAGNVENAPTGGQIVDGDYSVVAVIDYLDAHCAGDVTTGTFRQTMRFASGTWSGIKTDVATGAVSSFSGTYAITSNGVALSTTATCGALDTDGYPSTYFNVSGDEIRLVSPNTTLVMRRQMADGTTAPNADAGTAPLLGGGGCPQGVNDAGVCAAFANNAPVVQLMKLPTSGDGDAPTGGQIVDGDYSVVALINYIPDSCAGSVTVGTFRQTMRFQAGVWSGVKTDVATGAVTSFSTPYSVSNASFGGPGSCGTVDTDGFASSYYAVSGDEIRFVSPATTLLLRRQMPDGTTAPNADAGTAPLTDGSCPL
jgi:hypothetical protein